MSRESALNRNVGIFLVLATITVATSDAQYYPANFTLSNPLPKRGEVLTVTVDPNLEVERWDFGEADCHGNDPEISCYFLPAGACNTYQWTFPTDGEKSITMVLADGRTQTRHPTVTPFGECCLANGSPTAGFTMSADEAYTGETIVFTDLSSKATVDITKALGLSWIPTSPEIGESVAFTLENVVGDIARVTWEFGGPGCDEAASIQVCEPSPFADCKSASFTYASAGGKSVNVVVELSGGGSESVGPYTITVKTAGSCSGCSHVLNPTSSSYPPAGGSGSFFVVTTAECDWSASSSSNWVTIISGSGTGSGTVEYEVDPNSDVRPRATTIQVEGKHHGVTQAGLGDTSATEWRWIITRVLDEAGAEVDEDVFTSSLRQITYTFSEPGLFRVVLMAINCYGSDTHTDYVEITDYPIEDFLIGAAISQEGAYNTRWETDFRFYNPCGELLDVLLEFLPENTNNTDAELVRREFQLQPNETRTFADISEAMPELGIPNSGSVRIGSTSDSGCKVLSVSRTFNDTPEGSLGLNVPALPVKRVGREFLDVTGLIHNQNYRTNMRLVNYSDKDEWVPLTAFNKGGDQVGVRRSVNVKANSTKQINAIAEWLSIPGEPAPFSVRVEIDGLDILALGTVVDNITGDSVLYLSSLHDENQVWLAGVASLSGVNNSQWRTDLWLYNPTDDWLPGEVEFVVGDTPSESYDFEWPTLSTHRTKQYLDIVSDQFGLEETRGYIVLTGDDAGPAAQVSARTYNLDPNGGTYGLNLRAYGRKDLLKPGETGYIVGISNSEDLDVGFRTNFGVLNTDRNGWTAIRITMYNLDGSQAAEPYETNIAPGKLLQFNIFKKFRLDDITMTGSLKIEAVSGGAVAVYATEIDNRNQDSIFIPAQQLFMGSSR